MELVDRLGCYLWNPNPRENVTVTWSGGCSNGLAQGNGEVNWYQNDELIQIWETRLQDGHPDGPFVQRYGDGALEADGQHMNGEMQRDVDLSSLAMDVGRAGRSLCERRASRHLDWVRSIRQCSWGRYDSRTGDGWAGSMTRLR